jgi:hypothetical protein
LSRLFGASTRDDDDARTRHRALNISTKENPMMKSCMSCAFFKRDEALPEAKSGFCHRYPPTVFLIVQDFRTLFPPVRDEFTCGEHKSVAKPKPRLR